MIHYNDEKIKERSNIELIELYKKNKESNPRLALSYLNEGFLRKDPDCTFELALHYKDNIYNYEYFQEQAAKYGNVTCLEKIGIKLLKDDERNKLLSLYYFKRAADLNSLFSIYLYTILCYKRNEVDFNKYYNIIKGKNLEINFENLLYDEKIIEFKINEIIDLKEIESR